MANPAAELASWSGVAGLVDPERTCPRGVVAQQGVAAPQRRDHSHHLPVVERWVVPRMVGSSQYGGSSTGRPGTVLAQVRCAPSLHGLRCPPVGGGAHWLTIAGLVARGGTRRRSR